MTARCRRPGEPGLGRRPAGDRKLSTMQALDLAIVLAIAAVCSGAGRGATQSDACSAAGDVRALTPKRRRPLTGLCGCKAGPK